MIVSYIPGNTNTSRDVTVNVAGLGSESIRDSHGTKPAVGSIKSSRGLILKYTVSVGLFQVISGLQAGPMRDTTKGLVIVNGGTPDEQVVITADVATLRDVEGTGKEVTGINFTVSNIGGTGALKLFTGTVAIDTQYAIWVVSGNNGVTAGLHTSLDLATVLSTAPSGYQEYGALLGWIPTDGSSDFYLIEQRGNLVSIIQTAVLSGGSSGSFAAVDLSTLVPTTAIAVSGSGLVTGNTAGTVIQFYLSPNDSTVGQVEIITSTSGSAHTHTSPFRLTGITDQELFYRVNAVAGLLNANINISGWEY
jgi:hypothetical protein